MSGEKKKFFLLSVLLTIPGFSNRKQEDRIWVAILFRLVAKVEKQGLISTCGRWKVFFIFLAVPERVDLD
jgi:hypothetical protein